MKNEVVQYATTNNYKSSEHLLKTVYHVQMKA